MQSPPCSAAAALLPLPAMCFVCFFVLGVQTGATQCSAADPATHRFLAATARGGVAGAARQALCVVGVALGALRDERLDARVDVPPRRGRVAARTTGREGAGGVSRGAVRHRRAGGQLSEPTAPRAAAQRHMVPSIATHPHATQGQHANPARRHMRNHAYTRARGNTARMHCGRSSRELRDELHDQVPPGVGDVHVAALVNGDALCVVELLWLGDLQGGTRGGAWQAAVRARVSPQISREPALARPCANVPPQPCLPSCRARARAPPARPLPPPAPPPPPPVHAERSSPCPRSRRKLRK